MKVRINTQKYTAKLNKSTESKGISILSLGTSESEIDERYL